MAVDHLGVSSVYCLLTYLSKQILDPIGGILGAYLHSNVANLMWLLPCLCSYMMGS